MRARILIVDDDQVTTATLGRLLSEAGFVVEEVNESTEALKAARRFQPDAVILDFLMPRQHGGEVAWQLALDDQLRKTPRIILCSGVPTSDFELELPPVQIQILEKPVAVEALLKMLSEEPQEEPLLR